jgi:hypothetical protein
MLTHELSRAIRELSETGKIQFDFGEIRCEGFFVTYKIKELSPPYSQENWENPAARVFWYANMKSAKKDLLAANGPM